MQKKLVTTKLDEGWDVQHTTANLQTSVKVVLL